MKSKNGSVVPKSADVKPETVCCCGTKCARQRGRMWLNHLHTLWKPPSSPSSPSWSRFSRVILTPPIGLFSLHAHYEPKALETHRLTAASTSHCPDRKGGGEGRGGGELLKPNRKIQCLVSELSNMFCPTCRTVLWWLNSIVLSPAKSRLRAINVCHK